MVDGLDKAAVEMLPISDRLRVLRSVLNWTLFQRHMFTVGFVFMPALHLIGCRGPFTTIGRVIVSSAPGA